MAKCKKCGKKGLFLKINADGVCRACQEAEEHEKLKAERDKELSELDTLKAHRNSEIAHLDMLLTNKKETYAALVEEAKKDALEHLNSEITKLRSRILKYEDEKAKVVSDIEELKAEQLKKDKAFNTTANKLVKAKEMLNAALHSLKRIEDGESSVSSMPETIDRFLSPTVILKFHCMDVRQLRKEFTKNQRLIQETLTKYRGRYTTKTNAAIYELMVIALEAELQNILYNIGYGKLEKALSNVKEVTTKYENIASNGNQTIAPTIKSFIGEIEYLFTRAVEIEYEYYIQKERAREEQQALREQMRQEAAERKELERQQKHIEKEESKYITEMDSVNEMLSSEEDSEKIKQLEARLARLQKQLDAVQHTKAEILKLQTGKAGNIYIISNLGSFGNNVFKIGMTRRLDPTERVRELSSASVPFPFDVHSFIFSDDAVGLESLLHHKLNNQRLNKVNRRKEFFAVSIDELEDLVYELEPTAEFNRTMLAEQYNQSLSIDEVSEDYNIFAIDNVDDSEDDE